MAHAETRKRGVRVDAWLMRQCQLDVTLAYERVMGRELDEITGAVVDAAVKLHVRLGPGLLESVYEAVLARQLIEQGFAVQRQKIVSFTFEGLQFDEGFRVDLLVDDLIVVELKSLHRLLPVHSKQVLTYLRLLNLEVGLLINFGAGTLKEGLRRIVNNHQPSPMSPLRINRIR